MISCCHQISINLLQKVLKCCFSIPLHAQRKCIDEQSYSFFRSFQSLLPSGNNITQGNVITVQVFAGNQSPTRHQQAVHCIAAILQSCFQLCMQCRSQFYLLSGSCITQINLRLVWKHFSDAIRIFQIRLPIIPGPYIPAFVPHPLGIMYKVLVFNIRQFVTSINLLQFLKKTMYQNSNAPTIKNQMVITK